MMVGLFGGAFDPPHNGHVALARGAVEHFRLERLVVLVVSDPGHRDVHTAADSRLRLARAAFPGYEVELDSHARTVDMLREGRFADPVFLIGADELAEFLSWKEPDAVLELARLGVAARPGCLPEELEPVLARLRRPERVELFEIEPVPVSSTGIRERIARGESIESLVPPAVAHVVEELALYRS